MASHWWSGNRSGSYSESKKKDAVLECLGFIEGLRRNEQPYTGWHSHCYWKAFLLRSIRTVMRQKHLACGVRAAKAPHQTAALGDIVFASSVALHSLVLCHAGIWGLHKNVLRMQSCCKQICRIHSSCKRRILFLNTLLPKSKFSSVQFSTCCFLRVRLASTYPITRCPYLKRIQKMLRVCAGSFH